MMNPELIDWCASQMSGLEIRRHGPAGHHTPEDQPEAIAASLIAWLDKHNLAQRRPKTPSKSKFD
jgi:haloalkane dehalogenase